MSYPDSPFIRSFLRTDPLFRFHWLAFYQDFRREDTSKPPNVRDGASFAEISEALAAVGGRFGTLLLNRPSTQQEYERNRAIVQRYHDEHDTGLVEDLIVYRPVDVAFLHPGDTAVIVTRLPMNDLDWNHRLHLHPGFTTLEQALIRQARRYMLECRRGRVLLSSEIADQLPPEYADRGDTRYYQTKGAWYQSLGRADGVGRRHEIQRKEQISAGFMLHLPELECLNGANMLLVFGLGATQTLAFCHRLRTDLGHLLDHWGFTMVEMRATSDPVHATSLDYVKDWEMKVLVQAGVLS